MLKTRYDQKRSILTVEFEGVVDARQAEQCYLDMQKILPKDGPGFKLLTDFTSLEQMEEDILPVVKKTMDLLNERGVKEIVRVIPSLDQDYGFNLMSLFHYSKKVRLLTVKSRKEAEARLAEWPHPRSGP